MMTVFNRLGPFEISREIGRGGMAVVFLAIDTRTSLQVALKLVPQGTDREAREILQAEKCGAELQRQFSQVNTHVPAVYEHGLDDSGYYYVAMEYLDGENLSEVITRGPLAVERAVHIAVELCRFLDHAHRFEAVIDGRNLRSLLHLDLKPRNIRITSTEQIKVLDFGIAKALSLSRKVTRNDFGSVAYLSPERLETGEVDAFADFWAVGVLLYEMVSGTPPFLSPDTRRLERQILSRRPPPPLQPGCAIGVRAIVAKLLGPTPADRYDSASAIAEDLERFKAGGRTLAEEQGWPSRAADEQATRRTQPASVADEERTRRTRLATADPPLAAPRSPSGGEVTPVATAKSAAPPRKKRRLRRLLRVVLIVWAIGFVISEIRVAVLAGRLAETLPARDLEQLADAWAAHRRLAEDSALGLGIMELEESLTERTILLSDRVIVDYRMASPTVRETQWRLARKALEHAVARAPGDKRLRAALRYCDGHLHRIDGEAQKARRETPRALRELTEAVSAFREAAELRPEWPDPFLGLARTFIYGLEDVDRSADALNQAKRNGYTPSERDMAQLADGYRARGNSLVKSARELSGMPQERDFLARAAEAYRQALALYSEATTFSNVPQNIRLAQRALTQVEERLAELSRSTQSDPPIDSGLWRLLVPPAPPPLVSDGVPWA